MTKIWEMYENGKSKKKECPKCGKGVFLAEHKGRISCGKCGYTEFKK
ncbi:MAG: 30S ribosomal protein S27ae [Candidatus Woesearchaeota archaeon]|nr:30S ribosomal protein S27ae [Candidatus Woesearchaeota archaeon]